MSAQKQRKALIVYASITGNTEKVAMRFKQTIEKKGQPWGDWVCDTFKVKKKTYQEKVPYNLEDYDLFIVGAPIWAGTPPLYLFDDHLGALGKFIMPKAFLEGRQGGPGEGGPVMTRGPITKKGIVFVTYGGQGEGPSETQAALACLEIRLENHTKVIGKFACCGKQQEEPTVDPIAAKFDWMVGDATEAIARYKENPNDPEFAKLSAEERKLFDKAVKLSGHFSPGAPMGGRAWHWDFAHRPTDRDLLKAEIFLSEILEDCYGGGIEKTPITHSQYICIA